MWSRLLRKSFMKDLIESFYCLLEKPVYLEENHYFKSLFWYIDSYGLYINLQNPLHNMNLYIVIWIKMVKDELTYWGF